MVFACKARRPLFCYNTLQYMKRDFKELGVTLESRKEGDVSFYHFYKEKAPLTIYVVFDFGAIHGTKAGVAHFMEHLALSGTEKWPSKDIFKQEVQKNGWTSNAFTNKHRMHFPLWCNDKSDLPKAFGYFDQILNHSLFLKETIENERTGIDAEIRLRESQLQNFLWDQRYKSLFPEHLLSVSTTGTKEDVDAISVSDLTENFTLLKSSPVSVVSVGDCSIDDVVVASATFTQSFSDENSTKTEITYKNITPGNVAAPFPFKGARVEVIYNLPVERRLQEKAVLQFCHHLLFGQAGLLIRKLRFEKGLTYGVDHVQMETRYFGFFGVSVGCDEARIGEVEAEATKVFENSLLESVSVDAIQDFVDQRRLRRLRVWEKGDAWVDSYFNDLLIKGDETVFFNDVEDAIELMTIEQIKAEMLKVFTSKNRSILRFVGN